MIVDDKNSQDDEIRKNISSLAKKASEYYETALNHEEKAMYLAAVTAMGAAKHCYEEIIKLLNEVQSPIERETGKTIYTVCHSVVSRAFKNLSEKVKKKYSDAYAV
jgi:rhamnose utilization protein RhaD (predicted bifunctional aldolase and dehydrogenase)